MSKTTDPTTLPLSFPVTSQWTYVRDELFRAALVFFKGNRTHTAKSLGISVRTLQRWQVKGLRRNIETGEFWTDRK